MFAVTHGCEAAPEVAKVGSDTCAQVHVRRQQFRSLCRACRTASAQHGTAMRL